LYRAGEFAEALDTMNQALTSGVADAPVLSASLYQAAGGNGTANTT